ncbi:MAG: hypothetical protein QNJ40_04100 [Xanthomonadales bacterium]|nr:hypothetical protein [Xanthomonadales bacterium]
MTDLPQKVQQIKERGFAVFLGEGLSADFMAKFDHPIPVEGIRQVRVWGLQVDDERELPGHERTSIPDEERWEINIRARNGSCYEVDSDLLLPAP